MVMPKKINEIELKKATKVAIAGVTAVAGLLEVPPVTDLLKQAFGTHAHFMTLLGWAVLVASLRHDPRVRKALGVEVKEQVVTTTATVVPLASTPAIPEEKL